MRNIIINIAKFLRLVLALVMTYILAYAIFAPYGQDRLKSIVIIIGTVFLIAALMVIYNVINQINKKYLTLVAVSIFTVCIGIQILFGIKIRTVAIYDLHHIHQGAVSLISEGNIINEDYFRIYNNNIPILIVLHNIFSLFKGFDYKSVGIGFNIIMISIAIWMTYLSIKKISNERIAIMGLIIMTLNPILYVYASYYYTDTICLPFIAGGLYLFITSLKEETRAKKYISLIGAGIVLCIGIKVRATVAILTIAIVLYLLSTHHIKNSSKYITILVISILFTNIAYQCVEKQYIQLDKEKDGFPITHWIMMGHQSDGRYSSEDYSFTKQFETKKEREVANIQKLKERLEDMGIEGYLELVGKKIIRTWTNGEHSYKTFVSRNETYTRLYDFIFGNRNIVFAYYCQIFLVVIIMLIVIGLLRNIRSNVINEIDICYLTLIGSIVFYIIWESSPRYSLCFKLIMIMLMLEGIKVLIRGQAVIDNNISITIEAGKEKRIYTSKKFYKLISNIFLGMMLLTGVLGGLYYSKYCVELSTYDNLSVNQTAEWGNDIEEITKYQTIIQTFTTDKPFNNVEIKFKTNDRENTSHYKIEILDTDNIVLYSEDIQANDIKDNKYKKISFNQINPSGIELYQIKITTDDAIEGNALNIPRFAREYYDILPSGNLYVDNKEVLGDIIFKVYDRQETTYTTPIVYILFILVCLILEGGIMYIFVLRKLIHINN